MIDLVVVGGGQAGLAAGAAAAARGLSVIVCEKSRDTAARPYFSAGILWTAPDVPTLTALLPDGDPELGRVLVEGFEPAVAAARDAGVPVTERWTEHLGFGVAYRTDIHALHAHWAGADRRPAAEHAGAVAAGREGRVCGVVGGRGGDPRARRAARHRRLPGRQGAREDVPRLGRRPRARALQPRSRRRRVPAGARPRARPPAPAWARSTGTRSPRRCRASSPAATCRWPSTTRSGASSSTGSGRRYHDEALGDEVANQLTLRQPGARGVLLCDESVRRERVVSAPYPHGQVIDRFEHARSLGARITSAPTVEELSRAWGSGASTRPALTDTLERYEHGGRAGRADHRAGAAARGAVLGGRVPADDHVHARRRARRLVGPRPRPRRRA